jgi:hypothetical protein
MRLKIWSATCAALALGVSVGMFAQDAPAAAGAQADAAKKVVVVGCVAKAEPGATATAGAAAAKDDTKFMLNKAAASETAGTAGTNPPATPIASEYKLDGTDATLTPHVGHKVEITGTVDEAKGATDAPAASGANAPKLKVVSLKMVSPSCQ